MRFATAPYCLFLYHQNRLVMQSLSSILIPALALLSGLGLSSCVSSEHRARPETETSTPRLERIQIPLHLQSAQEQARYLLAHFWDRTNLTDSTLVAEESVEEAFADYCGLLTSFPAEQVAAEILYPLNQSDGKVLLYALSMYHRYLYQGGSPAMSDEHYRHVLHWAIRSPKVQAAHQEQARLLLDLLDKNAIGTPYTDLIYTSLDGSQHRLRHLKAPRTIVVFSTPDCPSCGHTLEELLAAPHISQGLESKQIGIFVLYLQCTSAQYQSVAPQLPESIDTGHDAEGHVLGQQLYDIKASPTIYLLERGGKVLLKDATPRQIEQYLRTNL